MDLIRYLASQNNPEVPSTDEISTPEEVSRWAEDDDYDDHMEEDAEEVRVAAEQLAALSRNVQNR